MEPTGDLNEDYSCSLPFEPWVTVSHHRDQALQTAKQSKVFECTCCLQESALSDVALAKTLLASLHEYDTLCAYGSDSPCHQFLLPSQVLCDGFLFLQS